MPEPEQRVGTTRSSKAILQPVNIDDKTLAALTSEYLPDDHFDAYALFQYLLSRELASLGADAMRADIYENISYFHRKELTVKGMNHQKNPWA